MTRPRPPARRGTKRGWFPVMGHLAPAEHTALLKALRKTGQLRTDFVREAVVARLAAESPAPYRAAP